MVIGSFAARGRKMDSSDQGRLSFQDKRLFPPVLLEVRFGFKLLCGHVVKKSLRLLLANQHELLERKLAVLMY